MKNQNQNQKPMLHLRVYSAYGNNGDLAYDRGGKVLNKNQVVKLEYDTLAYSNFLKNVKFLGYTKFIVEKITRRNSEGEWEESTESKSKYQHEFDVAFYGEKEADKMLAQATDPTKPQTVESKSTVSVEVGEGKDSNLDKLKADYFEAIGKKPYHGWDARTLRIKIDEATE